MSCRPSIESVRSPRFLIVQTGTTLPQLCARHGDFPEWFRRGLGLNRGGAAVVRVDSGEKLPDARGYAGVIVSGSSAMVSERLRWSEETALWLRTAIAAEVPVLGVCYGHQLLAHALGGRVDYHPSGREVGTINIDRLPSSADDLLLGSSPDNFLAHVSHRQSVLELPRGAVTLARSSHDQHHAVRYAPTTWGLQFHPEFSGEIMQGYLQYRSSAAIREYSADCAVDRTHAPAPHARRLLRRFRDIALARWAHTALAA